MFGSHNTMAITALPGWMVDPSNPNQVIRDTSSPNPVTPVTVPTTAPKAPSPVASSFNATKEINDKIVPTMEKSQSELARIQQFKDEHRGQPGYDSLGNPINGAPIPEQKDRNVMTMSAEDKILSQPDPGFQFVYDRQGNQGQIGIGANLPAGYTTINPQTGPTTSVSDSVQDTVGNKYVQFSDGSYGKYDPTGKYSGAIDPGEFNQNKDGSQLLGKITQATNGTYPLTPEQQSQVEGLKAQFQELIDEQKVSNANYTGGMTVAQNLYGMGNAGIGIGAIKGTVDQGLAKIASLNSKMASAVSQMTSAFKDDNLKALKEAYTFYNQASKDRQTEIDKLQENAEKARQDQRDYNYKKAQDEIDNALDSDKFTFEQAQAAIENALAEKKFTLEEKKAMEDAATKKMAANTDSYLSNSPIVSANSDGQINKEEQQAYLASLPGGANGDMANLVQMVAEYRVNLNTSPQKNYKGVVGQMTQDQIATAVNRYTGGRFNQDNFNQVKNIQSDFSSKGKTGQNINALNTSINHINDLAKDFAKMPLTDITKFNSVKKWYRTNVGKGDPTKVINDLNVLAGELAKTYKGTAGTDQEIALIEKGINVNSSPAQFKAFIESTAELLGGRLNAISEQWVLPDGSPMPGRAKDVLQPTAKSFLQNLKNNGYEINVKGVNYTDPKAYMKYGGGSQQSLNSAREALVNAGLPATPENILQAAQELNQ